MPKYAEGREKTERLVIPVTKAEHEFARNVTGEAGFAGKAREVLRAAGLLPALPCGAMSPVGYPNAGSTCTLPKGHAGAHEARDADGVLLAKSFPPKRAAKATKASR